MPRKLLPSRLKPTFAGNQAKVSTNSERGPGNGMDHEMGILVRQMKKIGIALTASAVLSAGAAGLLVAGGSGPVVLPYDMLAAINTSNTTVGFADSDIIGMSTTDINRTLDAMRRWACRTSGS